MIAVATLALAIGGVGSAQPEGEEEDWMPWLLYKMVQPSSSFGPFGDVPDLVIGETQSFVIQSVDDTTDYFRINVAQSGTLLLTAPGRNVVVRLYDSSGTKIVLPREPDWGTHEYDVTPGIYYVAVGEYYSAWYDPPEQGHRTIEVRMVGTDDHADRRLFATNIPLGGRPISGSSTGVVVEGDIDFFRIDVPQSGELFAYVRGVNVRKRLRFYNDEGLWRSPNGWIVEDSVYFPGEIYYGSIITQVDAGTYFAKVLPFPGTDEPDQYTLHIFMIGTDDHSDTPGLPGTHLPIGGSHSGSIDYSGDTDYFTIYTTEPGTLTVVTTDNVNSALMAPNGRWIGDYRDPDVRENDDNRRIEYEVGARKYNVQVRGEVGTQYTVHASFRPVEERERDATGSSRDNALTLPLTLPEEYPTSFTGSLEALDDIDYFRIDVTEPGGLVVQVRIYNALPEDTRPYILTLYDPTFRRLKSEQASNPRIYQNAGIGTYYASVRMICDHAIFCITNAKQYSIQANLTFNEDDDHGDTLEDATQLEIGVDQSGNLENEDDVDWFRVSVPSYGTLQWIRGNLYDSAGHLLCYCLEREVARGTYYVSVSARRNYNGPYDIRASFTPGAMADDDHRGTADGATSLSLGEAEPGRIERDSDVDYFRVSVREPGALRVALRSDSNAALFWRLYDAAGTQIFPLKQWGFGRHEFSEPYLQVGTYHLSVEKDGYGDVPMFYTVEANHIKDDHVNIDQSYKADSLALGGSQRGRIDYLGDADFFKVDVQQTCLLTIYTTGSNQTVTLHERGIYYESRLVGASSTALATGEGIPASYAVLAGTYHVSVRGNAGEDYTLHATCPTDKHGDMKSSGTALTPVIGSSHGVRTHGIIQPSDDLDYFRVNVDQAAGLEITGRAQPQPRDPSLNVGLPDVRGTLYDGQGNQLVADDDSDDGYHFRIRTEVGEGTYYLLLEGQSLGGYVVTVISWTLEDPEPERPEDYDDHGHSIAEATDLVLEVSGWWPNHFVGSLDGYFGFAGDIDYFRIDVPRSGTLSVYTRTSTDTVGKLYAGDGSLIATNDDGGRGGNFEIEIDADAGIYYVSVEALGAVRSHTYVVRSEFTPNTGGGEESGGGGSDEGGNIANAAMNLDVGDSYSTTVDKTDAWDVGDFYRVRLAQSATLTAYITGTTANLALFLYDDSEQVLEFVVHQFSEFDKRTLAAVPAGTYYISVGGEDGAGYTLHTGFSSDLPLNGNQRGSITSESEIDYFRLNVSQTGTVTVYATGELDAGLWPYGDKGQQVAWRASNGRLQWEVQQGTYYVTVEATDGSTGSYTIHASIE